MAVTVDVNNPPPNGFQNGAWYWDPAAGQARQFFNNSFSPPGVEHPESGSPSAGQPISEEVQRQSGFVGPTGEAVTSASVDPEQAVNETILETFQKLQSEVRRRFGEYRAGKPFRIDEVLAEKGAEASEQIDPYYNEILGDYLTGVTRKIGRSREDSNELLSELSASRQVFSEQSASTLEAAVDNAQQGFANAGLVGSGRAIRTEGRLKERSQSTLADTLRRSNLKSRQVKTGLERDITDIGAQKKFDVRNLERQRLTDVESRTNQLAKESAQQYVAGFQSILPPEQQNVSGIDFLGSLGVFS